jgi:hypothetical protein
VGYGSADSDAKRLNLETFRGEYISLYRKILSKDEPENTADKS